MDASEGVLVPEEDDGEKGDESGKKGRTRIL